MLKWLASRMESRVVCTSVGASRQIDLVIQGKTLVTPTYFPAISSYDVKYSFRSLIRHFTYYPRILISAYDWYFLKNTIREETRADIEKIPFVFLDSGVFEASRIAGGRWKEIWNEELHQNAMSKIKFDFHTSFDVLLSRSTRNSAQETIDGILRSREKCDKEAFVPIIHGSPKGLVNTIDKLIEKYPNLCNFVAVAERDCGDSIFEKARTVHRIRNVLDSREPHNHSRILHVLGSGDPISILLFIFAGANSFDSLDWIKYAFHPDRLGLVNFSHLDLLNCDCIFCSGSKKNYVERVLMHNLWFYQNCLQQIKTRIEENTLESLLEKYFRKKLLDKIERV
jgi:queuine/archaeosine tRNA-ribosyltransferase